MTRALDAELVTVASVFRVRYPAVRVIDRVQ